MIGCCVAVPLSYWSAVPTPLFIDISQLLRDSFSVSQQPPILEPPSHYSMVLVLYRDQAEVTISPLLASSWPRSLLSTQGAVSPIS